MSAGCRSRKGRWVLSFLCACRRDRLLIPLFPSQKNYNPQQAQRCRAGPWGGVAREGPPPLNFSAWAASLELQQWVEMRRWELHRQAVAQKDTKT